MAIQGFDFKNQYAMFGALSTGNYNGGNNIPKDEETISFGKKSVEGIGGQSEAVKVAGAGQYAGANLGFVDRLDRMDANNSLNRPTHASSVEGYDNGLAKYIDFEA